MDTVEEFLLAMPRTTTGNPAVPRVTVQRSSTEQPRPNPAQAAQAQAPSPLTRWLQSYGVPFTTGSQKKGSTDSQYSITASNVTTSELESEYRWLFHETIDSVPFTVTASGANLINNLRKLFGGTGLDSQPQDVFSLPKEWFTAEGLSPTASPKDFENFWRHNLRSFLNVYDPKQEHVKFRRQKDIENAKFPEPNVLNMRHKKLGGGGIAWNLTLFLASPTLTMPPDSEMDVERLHGNPLSGFFNVPECRTTSNLPISFREELLCFGSKPKPDFVARIEPDIIQEDRLDYDLYPITTLGETKKKIKKLPKPTHKKQDPTRLQVPSSSAASDGLSIPSEFGAKLQITAQLAFSAYPSLVVIIASLIATWQTSPPISKGKKQVEAEDYQIPEYAVIYGIGYASNGLLIYAFFPCVMEWNKNQNPSKWGFASVLVCREFSEVFRTHDVSLRFKLIKILLMLQQHAVRLKDEIKAVKRWPQAFLS